MDGRLSGLYGGHLPRKFGHFREVRFVTYLEVLTGRTEATTPTVAAASKPKLEAFEHGLHLDSGERYGELRATFPGNHRHLEVGAGGIREAHRFQLVKNGLQAILEVLQPVGVILVHKYLTV